MIAIVVSMGMQQQFFRMEFVQAVAKYLSILAIAQNVIIAGVIYDHFRKL